MLCSYRAQEAYETKKRIGSYIDYNNSNIFGKRGEINWRNQVPLAANWGTNLGATLMINVAFYFAS